MIFWVYIIECKLADKDKDEKKNNTIYYVGYTNDIERRLIQHRDKQSNFTKRCTDIKLAYWETYATQKEAMTRERELKKLSKEKKQRLILDFSVFK